MKLAPDRVRDARVGVHRVGKEIEMTKFRCIAITGAVLAALSSMTTGDAVAGRFDKSMETPIYNEATKSYFAIARVPKGMTTWPKARSIVQSMSYQGVRGRMATVNSRETMMFLRENFNLKYSAWIGARLVCNGRRILWEDGSIQQKRDFSHWHPRWQRTYVGCPNVAFMPLYITSNKTGSFWQASGPHKGFKRALVEFRTGKP
jgi:hypothetical protein